MIFLNENNQKDSDNFRQRKLTLKVRKLQTAEDQKQFQLQFVSKKYIFPEFTHLYMIVLGDYRDPTQTWTLYQARLRVNFELLVHFMLLFLIYLYIYKQQTVKMKANKLLT